MIRWLFLIFILQSSIVYSQNNIVVSFQCMNTDTPDIQINILKFYISKIELLQDNKVVFREKNSFHLVNFDDKNSLLFLLPFNPKKQYNKINFQLGIDSLTNIAGVMGGDLDPTKGMYWTWQSGYINFKLEGKSSKSNLRNNEFQFHLGGYKYPEYAMQNVVLNVDNKKPLVINFDVQKLLDKIDVSKINTIMSPSKEAVNISLFASQCFTIL